MLLKIIVRVIALVFLLSILTGSSIGNPSTIDWSLASNEIAVPSAACSLLSKAKEYQPSIGVSSVIDYGGLPRVDEILYKAYPGATVDTMVDEFLLGVTDWMAGPGRIDLYDQLVAAGEKISPFDPLPEFSLAAINCRDYKETSGTENFPLNDSAFRLALTWIYGVNDKQTDIFGYVGAPWTFAIGNPVPPAQKPWYNESIQMPDTEWTTAWDILQEAGYYVNATDNWLYKGQTKLRNMNISYSGDLFWEQGPGKGFSDSFNEFITTHVGATGPIMTFTPTSFSHLVEELIFVRNYDFICIGFPEIGRYVYWLYNYLHSDSIKSGAWNFAGISDSLFDQWTMSILTSVNEDEVIGNASLVQARFVYELMPWLPISCEMTFCTTANDSRGELVGIVSMPNLGPANDWSWMTAHWKDSTGGTVKVALTNTVHSMNPYNEDSVYGWRILDRSIAGLLGVSPITLTETPLVATEWSCTPWVSIPELGIVDGTILTFYLRQDVYWHDGKQVTAYDCVNNLKLLRKYRPGRYARVWASQAYEEVQGPYKFSTYSYTQGIYYAYDVADVALLSPKHITDAAEAMYGSILTGWDPAFNSYKALLGVDPPTEYPFMKQIVGCGPYVFDYYDKDIDLGRVVKYDDFFVKAPVISAVVGDWWIGSIAAGWEPSLSYPYTYKVLVQNIGAQANSSDSELVSVTVDVKVYEDNVLMHTESDIVLDPWSYTYLGPYTTDPVIGLHEIKVEILESGNVIHTYIHKYVAVVRQDITSYSGDFVDCFVDVKDLLRAAIAYGSYPGSSKWDAACDINDDYFVGIKDILSTVFVYGWHA